jgi:alkylation response protein AidB-like acyl-CoA dehydrogenase
VDFGDSPDEAAFRSSARVWLDASAPPKGSKDDFSSGPVAGHFAEEAFVAASKAWQGRLYEAGWAGIAWPPSCGGQGRTLAFDLIFQEEQASFGVTGSLFNVAIGMAGPTIIEHGDERQRARYLRPMLRGEEVWCQLFSEPEAGSDLAGIITRATPCPGGWRVNGHKVWTSQAGHADFGILLARTDLDAPKHRGITYFVLDMRSPGIEVRPIRQMNGAAEFNEVFLTNVFVSNDDVVGDVNGGWPVAMTTLANERNLVGSEWPGYDELVEVARMRGLVADPVVRQQLAGAWTGAHLLRLLGFRVRTALTRGEPLGALPSLVNLLFARHLRSTGDLGLALLGPAGALADATLADATLADATLADATLADVTLADATLAGGATDRAHKGSWQHHVLTAPCVRIASGTDEIQRNIVGERALGLPREPRANV